MKEVFDGLKEKGYLAYEVDDDGDKGKLLRKFKARVGKMIMVPPVVGG